MARTLSNQASGSRTVRIQHFGPWIVLHELSPIPGTREINLQIVAAENVFPVDLLPSRRCFPVWELLGIVADLKHVMKAVEAQPLKRKLQGMRPFAAKALAHNSRGRIPLPAQFISETREMVWNARPIPFLRQRYSGGFSRPFSAKFQYGDLVMGLTK